jgi:hypothetical protein
MKSAELSLDDQPDKGMKVYEVKLLVSYFKNKYVVDYLLVFILPTTGLRG